MIPAPPRQYTLGNAILGRIFQFILVVFFFLPRRISLAIFFSFELSRFCLIFSKMHLTRDFCLFSSKTHFLRNFIFFFLLPKRISQKFFFLLSKCISLFQNFFVFSSQTNLFRNFFSYFLLRRIFLPVSLSISSMAHFYRNFFL